MVRNTLRSSRPIHPCEETSLFCRSSTPRCPGAATTHAMAATVILSLTRFSLSVRASRWTGALSQLCIKIINEYKSWSVVAYSLQRWIEFMAGQILGFGELNYAGEACVKIGNPHIIQPISFVGFVNDARQTCMLLPRYVPLSPRHRRWCQTCVLELEALSHWEQWQQRYNRKQAL